MEKDIFEIRKDFENYKQNTNNLLDEILEKLKPQFTKAQITGFLLSFVGIMASCFIYVGSLRTDVDTLKIHSIDETLHMPFKDKIEIFVPRVELDSRMEDMKAQLDRIEKKLDK